MPLLVDGNNLLYAVCDALGQSLSRFALASMLSRFARNQDEKITVVFDGAPASRHDQDPFDLLDIQTHFAYPGPADTVLCNLLQENSAPRRLEVVSTDREIRKAARRRKAKSLRSEDFATRLLQELDQPDPPPTVEPPEKRNGLTEDQTRKWLREFGYE
jgi:predicted RNA-binding protein with PIN domain